MGGKTGKRRAKFLLSHRGLVKRPLCRPIHAGCLLTHLIIKILNNPPTSFANLHHCCHSISTTRSLGKVGLLGTNAREPHLHVHPCSLQHNDADIQLDRRCGLTGLIAPPYPGFLWQVKENLLTYSFKDILRPKSCTDVFCGRDTTILMHWHAASHTRIQISVAQKGSIYKMLMGEVRYGAVFPGSEVSSSTLQWKVPSFSEFTITVCFHQM